MAGRQRIPQPPIDPAGRSTERRPWWIGTVLALVGAVVLLAGLARRHDVGAGQLLPESDLVRLVTRGGIHRTAPGAGGAATTQADGAPKVEVIQNPPDYCPT